VGAMQKLKIRNSKFHPIRLDHIQSAVNLTLVNGFAWK
ncbi:MAG: hypothetical protein ACI91V_000395, partial [Lentimonas sp.]